MVIRQRKSAQPQSCSRKEISKRDLGVRENHLLATSEKVSRFLNDPILVNEVIYGVLAQAPKSGWSLQREVLTLPLARASSCSWTKGSPQTTLGTFLHFSLECPFFSSLSTAHFISASLHHRSICNVNWETRGSFSFGLVYGRIRRGIQNVLTQINGTNKSKISLAT